MKRTSVKTKNRIRDQVVLAQTAVAALADGREYEAEHVIGDLLKDQTGDDLFAAVVYWVSFIKPPGHSELEFAFVASVETEATPEEFDRGIHDNAGTMITAIGNNDLDGASEVWRLLGDDEFLDTAIAILVLAAAAYCRQVESVKIEAA